MAEIEESAESYEASAALLSDRHVASIAMAMEAMWDAYQVRPQTACAHPDFCREMAKKEPERVIRRIHTPDGLSWLQIAENCPQNACVVLQRVENDELTFSYMEVED